MEGDVDVTEDEGILKTKERNLKKHPASSHDATTHRLRSRHACHIPDIHVGLISAQPLPSDSSGRLMNRPKQRINPPQRQLNLPLETLALNTPPATTHPNNPTTAASKTKKTDKYDTKLKS